MAEQRASRGRRQRLTHAIRRQSAEYRSLATLRTNAERSTMPWLFIIASHIVVIVIIMILYRFPLSVGVAAVLFHGSRLVWVLGARRTHVQLRKTSVFLAEISLFVWFVVLCARSAIWLTYLAKVGCSSEVLTGLCHQSADCIIYTHLPVHTYACTKDSVTLVL